MFRHLFSTFPSEKRTFDYVFSHGVLHHTYSTEEALKNVSKFLKNRGYLYIWVYGIRRVTSLTRGLYTIFVQYFLRPKISKLPTNLQTVVLFPLVVERYLMQKIKHKKPNWNDLWLQTRDSHAVYHSHWQSMAEVVVWLKEAGMSNITPLEIEKIPRDLWGAWRANVGLRSQYIEFNDTQRKNENKNGR